MPDAWASSFCPHRINPLAALNCSAVMLTPYDRKTKENYRKPLDYMRGIRLINRYSIKSQGSGEMFNRSEILRNAWAAYARDKRIGIIARKGPFNRAHFAYCLRMEWAIAKAAAAKAAALVAEREALIAEAASLNKHPALAHSDFVAYMRGVGIEECRFHVSCMRGYVQAAERGSLANGRIAAIRSELAAQDFDDRIDWTRRAALRSELAELQAA